MAIRIFGTPLIGILGGYVAAQFGANLIMPFLMVYLHNGLGLSPGFGGLVIGLGNVSGMLLIPLSGLMGERLGVRSTTVWWIVVSAFGWVCFGYGRDPSVLVLASITTTGGMAAWWNSLSTMLAELSVQRRTDIFAVAYVLQNIGGGAGAFVGGRWIHGTDVSAFFVPVLIASLSLIGFAALVLLLGPTHRVNPASRLDDEVGVAGSSHQGPGFSAVSKSLVGLGWAYGLFAVVITALPGSVFSVWAVNVVGVSTRIVGTAFTVNTSVIIVGQFVILRWLKGYRRTWLCICSALCYATGAALVYVARYHEVHWEVLTEVYGAFVLFGVGDTLLFPIIPALVNDLADAGKRGRYNSTINFCWQAASMVGPAWAGLMLQNHWNAMFFVCLVCICVVIVFTLLVVNRVIPAAVNRG